MTHGAVRAHLPGIPPRPGEPGWPGTPLTPGWPGTPLTPGWPPPRRPPGPIRSRPRRSGSGSIRSLTGRPACTSGC